MSRFKTAIALALLVALSACGSQAGSGRLAPIATTGLTAAPPPPPFEAVDDATEAEANPFSLVGMPSAESLRLASVGRPSRLDAERFALEVTNFSLDVRPLLENQDVLESVASPSLSRRATTFVVQDKAVQRDHATRRHLDDRIPMWIRSRPSGPTTTPREVAVEVAGVVEVPVLGSRTWVHVRVDVVRRDGGWRLADLSTTDRGAADVTSLGRPPHLTGPGWRELAAGRPGL
ncbi:hypothetical protein ASD11_02695 [Aeromicrobium sp. Root495]|uniref:hypothetical protein n=1 Tax=Aeromicrobium sp. Root495 TaxID=1736550 RepID=UPI0006F3D3F6|nr:hypothetical protein [Aeromicrobium sp. Root495]KQY58583.1 hypothetical protein ASD11_02695 [Aeromicrobium sp. Root495]